MQVDPADVRFTQDSISAYFQSPYNHFGIREAVKNISRNEMRPGDFPRIRVISRDGCLWSLDNRRLWVFRFARCSRISVSLVTKMHPRLQVVLSDYSMYQEMIEADFFPRVRGIRDAVFDLKFQQPSAGKQTRVETREFSSNDAVEVKKESVRSWANWPVDQRLPKNDATNPQFSQEPAQDHAIHGITEGGSDLAFQQPSSVEENRSGPCEFSSVNDAVQVKNESISNRATWKVDQGLTENDATGPEFSQDPEQDHAILAIREGGSDLAFQQPSSVEENRSGPYEFSSVNDAVQVKTESICNRATWKVDQGLAENDATGPEFSQDPGQDHAIRAIRDDGAGFDLTFQPGPSSVKQNRSEPWEFSASIDAVQVKESVCNWQVDQGLAKKEATQHQFSDFSQEQDHGKAEKCVERTSGNSTSTQEPKSTSLIQNLALKFVGYFKSCLGPR